MFDEILKLVKENATEAVTNNPDIPGDKKEGVLQEAASSIFDGLKGEASGGGLQNILGSFSSGAGGGALTGLIDKMKGSFVQNLVSKLGFDSGKASGIASMLIPLVINKLFHKTADPADNSFSVQGLLSSFGGGDAGGILGKVKDLF